MTTVTNSFWDAEATGLTSNAGGGTGLTTAEMKNYGTYQNADWDFACLSTDGTDDSWSPDIENINNGYPVLAWQTSVDNCLLVTSTEELTSRIAVYPNPTRGPVTITAEGRSIHRIEVYNVMGVLVQTSADQSPCQVMELDLTDQSPGIYLIRTFDGEKTSTHRVILQK